MLYRAYSVSFVCMEICIGCIGFVCERKLKKQSQKNLICHPPFTFLVAKPKKNHGGRGTDTTRTGLIHVGAGLICIAEVAACRSWSGPDPQGGGGGGSTDPKIVARNNVLCRRWRFCFRHTAGGKFFVRPYVFVLKILSGEFKNGSKAQKKDFDPVPASRSDLGGSLLER